MRDVHAEDADTCGRCQVVPEIDEWSRVVLRGLADGWRNTKSKIGGRRVGPGECPLTGGGGHIWTCRDGISGNGFGGHSRGGGRPSSLTFFLMSSLVINHNLKKIIRKK